MQLHCSPREQIIFDQLKLVERRRSRVLEAAISRFPSHSLRDYLRSKCPELSSYQFRERLDDEMDDSGSSSFLEKLALTVQRNEAIQARALLSYPQIDAEKIKVVIFEGAQVAGQDAARNYLRSSKKIRKLSPINLSNLYSILNHLVFFELPNERSAFSTIRPLSDISIHFRKCVHINAWNEAEVNTKFMCQVEQSWIQGILELIRPDITLIRVSSIAYGDSYGRDKYIPRDKNVAL